MGMLDEMKKDISENVVDAILNDEKTQKMLEIANPFIKPALKGLLKELGNDERRMLLFLDNDTGLLCFMKIHTKNIVQFEVDGITKEDIFTIDPADVEKGNLKEVIGTVIKKLGVKMM